jgi:hypothetical protein
MLDRVGSLEDFAPSSKLRHFCLKGIFIPRIPSWINSLCVPLLSELWLQVEVVEARDFQALGRLPSLLQLCIRNEEEMCISYTFGTAEFQKLERLMINIEISFEEGALPRLTTLMYCASAGKKASLVPWNNSCPLLDEVVCRVDCTNSSCTEVMAAEAVLWNAKRSRPNAEHLRFDIQKKNYNPRAALGLILHGLERPHREEIITADHREIHRLITSLDTLLLDGAEPQVWGRGEHELRCMVTKFKRIFNHHVCADQEEVVCAYTTLPYRSIPIHI